ncbi:Protein of unknown function [Gryllus bimaculatus]|nr:Protein of unknown function [Gryllus bimaculatus]
MYVIFQVVYISYMKNTEKSHSFKELEAIQVDAVSLISPARPSLSATYVLGEAMRQLSKTLYRVEVAS